MNNSSSSVETSLSKAATHQAYDRCDEFLSELKEKGMLLTSQQECKLYKLVGVVAQDTVRLCKNKINNL